MVWLPARSQEENMGTNKHTRVEIEGGAWSHGSYKRLTFRTELKETETPLMALAQPPFPSVIPTLTLSNQTTCSFLNTWTPLIAILSPLPGMPLPPLSTRGQPVFPPDIIHTSASLRGFPRPLQVEAGTSSSGF